MWDLNKGNLIATYPCGSKCYASATDGYTIYTGHNNGSLKGWQQNKKTAIIDTKINSDSGSISYMLLSTDNNYLVSMSKGNDINVIDLRMHKTLKSLSLEKISFPNGRVQFDIDKQLSRAFIGDNTGTGTVGFDNQDIRLVGVCA